MPIDRPPHSMPTLKACPRLLLDDVVGPVMRRHRRLFIGDLGRCESYSRQLHGSHLLQQALALPAQMPAVLVHGQEALIVCPSYVLEGMIEVMRADTYVIGRLRLECGFIAIATAGLVAIPGGRHRDYPAGFLCVIDDPLMTIDAPSRYELVIDDICIDTSAVPEPHFSRWRDEPDTTWQSANDFRTIRQLCAP